jgi:hypothetical protein
VSDDLFRVVWADSGAEVTHGEMAELAHTAPWTDGLTYSDMQGFAVESDGSLLLLDECGAYCSPPVGLFRVEWNR